MKSLSRTSVKLGTAANLLLGYKSTWNPLDLNDSPFYSPAKELVHESDPIITPNNVNWSYPNITIHDDTTSLVSEINQYKVAALTTDKEPPNIPSGPLILEDKDHTSVVKSLSKKFNIDLTTPNQSYMLVKLERKVGSASHKAHPSSMFVGRTSPSKHVSRALQVPLYRLKPGAIKTEPWMIGRIVINKTNPQADPSLDHIKDYISFFGTYGTHYVSEIEAGDVIYQIFAYQPKAFAILKKAYNAPNVKKSGIGAVAFEYYTTPNNNGFGFTSAIGNILNISNDPNLAKSIKTGHWDDKQYALTNSVFNPFQPGSKVDLNSSFNMIVPISISLSPLSNFADTFPKVTWNRIFKAVMFQKYGDSIHPNFEKTPTYPYDEIFPQTWSGFLSTIATPNIDVYKDRLQISEVELVAAEEVKNFTIFSNVLQLDNTKPFAIPGDNVNLIAHVIDIPNVKDCVPILSLSDKAYNSFTLACQEFGGSVTLVNTSGTSRNVIVDGFLYKLEASHVSGRYTVVVDRDVRQSPEPKVLDKVSYDIEMSLTTCESLLSARSSTASAQSQKLILKYLNWIGLSISEKSSNKDLLESRVRALYLARVAAKLKFGGQIVPYLKYATYQPLVDSIQNVLTTVTRNIRQYQQDIQFRKQEELIIDVGKALNKNIIASGKLLAGYIDAMAQQQSDMDGFYGAIVAQKKQELIAEQNKIKALSKLLQEQQKNVNQSVINYQDAAAQWAEEQIAKFVFDIALNVFTIGVTVAAPGAAGAEVTALAKMIEKLKKILEVVKTLNEIWKNLLQGPGEISAAIDALNSIGYDGSEFPTSREWQEFSVNMNLALSGGPDIPARTDLSAAFQILVIRGQSLLVAQTKIQQIAGEIYLNSKKQDLAKKQQARLNALKKNLNPASVPHLDKSKIDLLGLTGEMQLVQKQMLAMLSNALILQDEAIQYEYLQPLQPITTFDLLGLKQVMVSQQQTILNGLASIKPPPSEPSQPLVFKVEGVKTSELTNGNRHRFSIPLSATCFAPYAMIRIKKVIVSIGTEILSTKSGEYVLETIFQGDPFQDRDQNRQPLTFFTLSRELLYLYDAKTGAPKFGRGTGTWDDKISRITPFSEWTVFFPENSINKELKFKSDTVDILMSFEVEALLRPSASTTRPYFQAHDFSFEETLLAHESPLFSNPAPTANPQPGVSAVLEEMHKIGTVMNGWDAVLNLTESNVNTLLFDQYKDRASDPTFFWKIPAQTSYGPVQSGGTSRTVTEFALTLGTPEIQFLENNVGNTNLTMNIVSGTYSFGVQSESSPGKGDWGPITWVVHNATVGGKGESLAASVPLADIQGDVKPKKNIVLNLAEGSFQAKNMKITDSNPNFNVALTNFMEKAKPTFLIGTIDFTKHSSLASLTPTKFEFNTYKTNSGLSILQIFIATTGKVQNTPSLNINEPIPVGYETSLIINTKILFNSIMVESFKKNSAVMALEGIDPGSTGTPAWSSQVSQGSFSAQVPPFGDVRISSNSNTVTVSMVGMKFTPSKVAGILASLDNKYTQHFEYQTCTPIICNGSTCSWNGTSVPIEVKIDFPMPIVVSGTGQNQSIDIQSSPANVSIVPTLDASGPCKKNSRSVQQEMSKQMNNELPTPLTKAVNVGFNELSIFALQNLLFPGKNYFTMNDAYAPGDLVLFGAIAMPAKASTDADAIVAKPIKGSEEAMVKREIDIPLNLNICKPGM